MKRFSLFMCLSFFIGAFSFSSWASSGIPIGPLVSVLANGSNPDVFDLSAYSDGSVRLKFKSATPMNVALSRSEALSLLKVSRSFDSFCASPVSSDTPLRQIGEVKALYSLMSVSFLRDASGFCYGRFDFFPVWSVYPTSYAILTPESFYSLSRGLSEIPSASRFLRR